VSATEDIKKCIELLVNQYKARLASLKGLENKLKENFRFRKLTFPDNDGDCLKKIYLKSENTIFSGSETAYPNIPWGEELDYTVIVLLYNSSTGIYYSESVTVPFTSQTMTIGIPFSSLSEEVLLQVGIGSSGMLEFGLHRIPSGYTAKIGSIYYQDFYGHGE
jgi:hypothetical protein